ncbi:methyltransferase domain-containing protein [Streptomyces sp. SID4946]|nr:methyltransferase domain-containing protein [Streptomyces sp. SID4946]
MGTSTERLVEGLRRFNDAHPWDHNAHYHPWLLRQLPRRSGRALDVGCGAGELARLLAGRVERVEAVDADPEILARAREHAWAAANVRYTLAAAPDGLPPGPYDVITCVAVLHHLPFAETLTRFRAQLAPGGTLVVVGCARDEDVRGMLSVPLNALFGWVKNRGRAATERPVGMTAPVKGPEMDFSEIAGQARRLLPGVRLRRGFFWRYTLVWRAPREGEPGGQEADRVAGEEAARVDRRGGREAPVAGQQGEEGPAGGADRRRADLRAEHREGADERAARRAARAGGQEGAAEGEGDAVDQRLPDAEQSGGQGRADRRAQ